MVKDLSIRLECIVLLQFGACTNARVSVGDSHMHICNTVQSHSII